jgi:hypothetical protein
LQAMAAELETRLSGCAPHGTPFSAELVGEGLLSWGADPQFDNSPGRVPESWREYVCNRLAFALVTARSASPTDASLVRFALDRLRLDGIDPDAWAPTREFLQ